MTMRKNPNQREIIDNMILLRKYNIKIASLKYKYLSVGSLTHGNKFCL